MIGSSRITLSDNVSLPTLAFWLITSSRRWPMSGARAELTRRLFLRGGLATSSARYTKRSLRSSMRNTLLTVLINRSRYALTAELEHRPARLDWQFADTLSPKDFEAQIGSTVNRLLRFIQNEKLRTTFGLPDVSLIYEPPFKTGRSFLSVLPLSGRKYPKRTQSFSPHCFSVIYGRRRRNAASGGVSNLFMFISMNFSDS